MTITGLWKLSATAANPRGRALAFNFLLLGVVLRFITLFLAWRHGLPLLYAVIAQIAPITLIFITFIIVDKVSMKLEQRSN